MPDPATIGAFPAYTARLAQHGELSPDGTTDTYLVYVVDPDERLDPADVIGLPEAGDEHPVDSDLTVSEIRVADHRPGELIREVQVVYTRGEEETEGSGSQTQSIGRLTALDYPVYTQTGDLVTDQISGAPVLNSAGDVFDSVPQFETLLTGVHFVRRVANFSDIPRDLSGTLNRATVSIYGVTFSPRTARCRISARNTLDGSKRPYEMDVTIEPRRNLVDSGAQYLPDNVITTMGYTAFDIGWDIAILECGFQYLDTGTGEKLRFTVQGDDGSESAPQLPQLLTATGEDGRAYGSQAFLIVRTAPGADWSALKAKTSAP